VWTEVLNRAEFGLTEIDFRFLYVAGA